MDCRIKYFIVLLILPFPLGVLFPFCLLAQDDLSPVQFHGTNVLVGQYSSMQGVNSMLPQNFMRNDLQMTLSLYDVPFSTSFYLTTEESDMKQRIGNLGFSIDLNTLKRNKARIESMNKKENLDDTRAPWRLRFLSKFSKIEVGRFRPNYGDLTLSRIPVSGVNLEFTDKLIYAAFTSGRTKQNVESKDSTKQTYGQNLIFGKLGIGEKMKSHFYLTYMDVNDQTQSQNIEMIDSTLKPISNKIFGTEFRLSLFKHQWIIDGEAGFSSVTRDTRIEQEIDSFDISLPDFVLQITNPNISSSFDYAYGFSTKISLPTTSISGDYRWIGPGYYTLGNPNLVNDRQTIEGRIDQVLFKRKVNLSAFYKKYNDNLINTKEKTTFSDSYGITAKLTLRKFPFVQISYIPIHQKTEINSHNIFNENKVFNLSTGYNYSINKIRSYSGFSYFNQNSNYKNETITNQSINQTYAVNQALLFNVPIRLNFNMGYTTVSHTQYDLNLISFVLSGTHTYKRNLKNTLGFNYMKSKKDNISLSSATDDNKSGFYWESQIKIWEGGDLGLNIKKNVYQNKEKSSQNFSEWLIQSKLTIKW